MRHFTSEILSEAPTAQSVRLVSFDTADVRPGFINETYLLTVTGEKPYLNMDVYLSPVFYTHQPDYWRIDVIGILNGFGLPGIAPYSTTLDITGFIGTQGIEVVGANKSEKIGVFAAGDEICNENGNTGYRARQVNRGVTISADGSHSTSGIETFWTELPIDVFPPQFILKHRRTNERVLEVVTPFHVNTTFDASEPIASVTIHDAMGAHEIEVEQGG